MEHCHHPKRLPITRAVLNKTESRNIAYAKSIGKARMNEMTRIESAISFIPAIDREPWVEIGMAVKSEQSEAGRDPGIPESAAESYRSRPKAVWRSIKSSGRITVASITTLKAHGWRDDARCNRFLQRQIAERRQASIERLRRRIKKRKKSMPCVAGKLPLLAACELANHPYLRPKAFQTRALVDADGAMPVPMRDCLSGKLLGVQKIALIDNEWTKKMPPGMQAKAPCAGLAALVPPTVGFRRIRHRSERRCRVEALRLGGSRGVLLGGNLIYVAGNSPPTLRVRGQRRQPDGEHWHGKPVCCMRWR